MMMLIGYVGRWLSTSADGHVQLRVGRLYHWLVRSVRYMLGLRLEKEHILGYFDYMGYLISTHEHHLKQSLISTKLNICR